MTPSDFRDYAAVEAMGTLLSIIDEHASHPHEFPNYLDTCSDGTGVTIGEKVAFLSYWLADRMIYARNHGCKQQMQRKPPAFTKRR